jgi:undecaprenyl pyrophosphate synthase
MLPIVASLTATVQQRLLGWLGGWSLQYPQLFPKHVAFIMDGNRRYAKRRGWHSCDGHLRGFEALQEVCPVRVKLGLQ